MLHSRVLAITSRLVLALVAASLASACDDEPTIGDRIDEYVELINDQSAVVCDCYEELGYDSRAACQGRDEILPSQRRCIEDALERSESSSRDWLDCVLPLEREYLACIDSRLTCDDLGENSCIDDYYVGEDRCIALPVNVERALDDCDAG